jgi:hypothetical protein
VEETDDAAIPHTENTEVVPLPDLPDPAQPDTANPDGLTNTKNNQLINLISNQKVRSEIPRDAHPVDNTGLTSSENPKRLFRMAIDWYPRDEFLRALSRAGLPSSYPWEEDLPEFWMYGIERGEWRTQAQWEHALLRHVIRSKQFHETDPKPIEKNWGPTEPAWSLIIAQGIDRKFARELVPEFILYWSDAGDKKRSWSDTFVNFVKQRWAHRLPLLKAQGTVDR